LRRHVTNSFEAVSTLRALVGPDILAVAGIGRAAHAALTLWPERTVQLDALGDILPVALGLALGLAETEKVHVVSLEGDGSALFGLGGLATLATVERAVGRFTAVVVDNGILESAGGAPSRSFPLDWSALAKAFGVRFAQAASVADIGAALDTVMPVGLLRLQVADTTPLPRPTSQNNGSESVYAFRRLLASAYGIPLAVPSAKF
jgi:thiamine pyrophosphate-dependent acetolactate synthase large subunit-like protein